MRRPRLYLSTWTTSREMRRSDSGPAQLCIWQIVEHEPAEVVGPNTRASSSGAPEGVVQALPESRAMFPVRPGMDCTELGWKE